jgi:hypothetical protein
MFPSDRFAALLAHLLNDDDAPVFVLRPGEVYVLLSDALAQRYKDDLLYHSTYAGRMSAEEAAERYFQATLERALWLSNKVDRSIAHRFLLALCQRGIGPAWSVAELVRQAGAPPARDNVASLLAPGSFEAVAARLARLPAAVSAGNPASTIRLRRGALWLIAGTARTEIPEEISIWNAIDCAPAQLKSLPAGEPFNRFCGIVIDAMRTANRPFQELLGLGCGLCPFDWLDVLSVNQVRGLRRFLGAVAELGGEDSLDTWKRAWEHAPVPGHKTIEDLWSSEVGRALRQAGSGAQTVPIEEFEGELYRSFDGAVVQFGRNRGEAPPAEVLGEADFAQRLCHLKGAGVISEVEHFLLNRLYFGDTLAELAIEPEVQQVLRSRRIKFPQLIVDLQRRIQDWQGARELRHG